MIFRAKHYRVEYDADLLRLEVVKTFEDEVLVVLRTKNNPR